MSPEKDGVTIPTEMKFNYSVFDERHGREDAEALQTMLDNVKKAFSSREEGFSVADQNEAKADDTAGEMVLNSDEKKVEKPRPPSKANTKKGISSKVKEVRRFLIHVLCGSGMLIIFTEFYRQCYA